MPNVLSQLRQLLLHSTDPVDPAEPSPFAQLATLLKRNNDTAEPTILHCEAHGAWGSLPRLLASLLGNELSCPVLFLAAHVPDADEAQDDIESFTGQPALLFPAAETHESELEPTSEAACERLRICQSLATGPSSDTFIATPIQAVMQTVPNLQFLKQHSLTLDFTGHSAARSPEAIASWLIDHDFTRVDQVDIVGEFAIRGGIVDIFAPAQDHPIRVEFFGDEIESLRFFDLDTQRSIQSIDGITLNGCRSTTTITDAAILLDYLPPTTLLVIEEPAEITEVGRIFHERLTDTNRVSRVEDVLSRTRQFNTLYIGRFPMGLSPHAVSFQAQSIQRFENQLIGALDELVETARTEHVLLFCENSAEQQRVTEIIQTNPDDRAHSDNRAHAAATTANAPQKPLPEQFHIPVGLVHRGFALPDSHLILLSHHELFAQQHRRRRIRRIRSTQAIDSFNDLEKGDLVVHVTHGIGRYRGMKTLTKNDRQEEFLTIEYAQKAVVHVPASNIDLVHKYVGAISGRPKLSKLGTQTWQRQKDKAQEAVEDMAAGLIELQAHRQTQPGIAYADDTIWQHEFEDSFPYQDTDDQVTTNVEIKKDMQQRRPMDRLLCGDVGYGKTELAIRATFKAVEFGKQVAVLVPTTILAEQHYRTFCERLADFPFIVESISRFKTAGQAKDIVTRTARGQVDVLIGTHRLLSKDVSFRDLGFVIIDEEQRFGVEHKERLKRMRKTVDVLTMTATPIPRTLHLSLLGIRDISSLGTPPLDRRSIVTEVCNYDKNRIRQAILRELGREGQVYYVHNRVQDIQATAASLQQLVPEARLIIGHGQMPKHELENRMIDFVNHKADILVCTTIIESGLDIPNANTIIIDNADRFGLAELHQLRGRVGRYKNRAYAYVLLPEKRTINPTAVKRLKAIEEYSQLGSGFRIAMRDLEIRGAGNILGVEQSGHIEAVGYELYCRLLATAVRQQKGQPEPQKITTHLDFNISNNIPRSYIPSDRQRLDFYRRLATCSVPKDIDRLEQDLTDLFGKPPRSVADLLQLAEIRVLAAKWPIKSIVEERPDLIFSLHDPPAAEPLFARAPGTVRVPDTHTVYVRLPENYFESTATLFAVLRRFLAQTS